MRERRITAGAGRGAWCGIAAVALIFALGPIASLSAFAQTALPEAPLAAGEPAPQDPPPAAPEGPAAPPVGGDQSPPSPVPAPGDAELVTIPSGTGIPADPAESGGPDRKRTFVDTLHGGVSSGFLSTATWLDSFFGDDRYEAEINRSQLKIRFDAFREGVAGVDYRRPNFDLRLVLPQLRKKTRLVISGDPNVDEDTTTVQPGGADAVPPKTTERNLTTALQYVPIESFKTNFSIRAGVKFHAGKFEILAGPRYRYLISLNPWALRFTEEVLWSSDMRWQSRTRFDLERSLPRDLFFRSSLEGLWSENVPGYSYNLSFTLQQPLDRDRALQYEWINTFQTYPTDALVEELLVFRYRQRFWRDWLFLEIAPQYRFPRDKSFEAQPGILFRLEMVFGNIGSIF